MTRVLAMLPLLLVALAAPARAGDEPQSLLILDFQHDGAAGAEQQARLINDLVAAAATRSGAVRVITSADIKQVAQLESDRQTMGCDDTSTSCLAELAGAMGAGLVLFGNVGRLGDTLVVTLNLFDSGSARSAGRETARARDMNALPGEIDRAVARLLGVEAPAPAGPDLALLGGVGLVATGAAVGAVGLLLASGQNDVLGDPRSTGADKDGAFVLGHTFFWGGLGLGAALVATGAALALLPEVE